MIKKYSFLILIAVWFIILPIIYFSHTFGQLNEIGRYNNSQRTDLGDGKHRFEMAMARSFAVYSDGEWTYNIAGRDTIKYKIIGVENHKVLINNGNAEDVFNVVDADSFTYEINTNFDIEEVEEQVIIEPTGRTDTIKKYIRFRKDGQTKLRLLNVKGFDENEMLVKLKSVEKSGKKVKYKFEKKVKKVDPTWSWQPDPTEGLCAMVAATAAGSNYGNHAYAYVSAKTTPRTDWIFIRFNAIRDSMIALGISSSEINSVHIKFTEFNASTGTPNLYATSVDSTWTEATITWNNKPPTGAYTPDDTITYANPCSVEVTSILKDIRTGAKPDSGFVIKCVDTGGDSMAQLNTDDDPTPGDRPQIVMDYTEGAAETETGILKPVVAGRIKKSATGGRIRKAVKRSN